jgi:hypothetical protein
MSGFQRRTGFAAVASSRRRRVNAGPRQPVAGFARFAVYAFIASMKASNAALDSVVRSASHRQQQAGNKPWRMKTVIDRPLGNVEVTTPFFD